MCHISHVISATWIWLRCLVVIYTALYVCRYLPFWHRYFVRWYLLSLLTRNIYASFKGQEEIRGRQSEALKVPSWDLLSHPVSQQIERWKTSREYSVFPLHNCSIDTRVVQRAGNWKKRESEREREREKRAALQFLGVLFCWMRDFLATCCLTMAARSITTTTTTTSSLVFR